MTEKKLPSSWDLQSENYTRIAAYLKFVKDGSKEGRMGWRAIFMFWIPTIG